MPTTFAEERKAFYDKNFPEFWEDIDGHDYALFDAHLISEAEASEIRQAAESAWKVFTKTGELLRNLPPDVLKDEMGIPETAVNVVRTYNPLIGDSVVTRFDFIKTPQGYKVIELNAETPFFYWESNRISGEVVKALGHRDPNAGAEEALGQAVANAIRATGKPIQNIAVTAYNPYREDIFTAMYIREVIEKAIGVPVRFTPIHELQIDEDGAFDNVGSIDFLYRCYPIEHFAVEDGCDLLFSLIEQGKLVVINPPSALLIQNKMTQTVIWNLYEENTWFNAEEREAVSKYFLPTYADLPQDGKTYVQKPVLGREGNSVTIIKPDASTVASENMDYDGQPMTYQLCVEQPMVKYRRPCGEFEGYAITTCFVVGGKATAIGMRVSPKIITDGWAYFMPIGLE